jgi:hypothetical protein
MLCMLACVAQGAAAQAVAPPHVRGESAFLAGDIAESERAFREVLATDTVAIHRVEAVRVLTSIAWRVRRDTMAASALLALGEQIPLAAAAFRSERARMLQGVGDFDGARRAATAALCVSNNTSDSAVATVAQIESIVEPWMRNTIDGHESDAFADTSLRQTLRGDVAALRQMVRANPGQTRLAKTLVNASVLTGSGDALLDGWHSYFLIGTGDTARGVLLNARHALDAILPGRNLTSVDQRALRDALAGSRFFDAAAVVAMMSHDTATSARSRAEELVQYARFLNGVERATNDYYRQVALGRTDTTEWHRQYTRLSTALWPHLVWPGVSPKFDTRRLASELDARFGTYVNFGKTSGYNDLHMGHRVVDERRRVTQYGHSADLRFVALDAMTSDGFQTWLWDGRAGHGGWATKEMIVQVRPNYADATLDAWSVIADPVRRALRDRELAADSISDLERARSTPVAYFPSVPVRMRRDAENVLVDSLVSAGLSGSQLEGAFERLYGDAVQEASIFVHEGRHAIDKRIGTPKLSQDLEYNAKLSELAFAPRPKLSITGIMLGNLGDETPHGKANERLARGLLSWMEAHRAEIRGLDPDAPLLPQLPLLTDAQLRATAASLDPMARAPAR